MLTFFVGLMFVTMVGAAAVTLPNLPELLNGLVPRIPDGGLVNVLALAGGVGGTITLAAYGYWLREKGWSTPKYMRVMRIDNNVAYLVTGLFVIATLIVGAELLYSANIAVSTGDKGMLDLSNVLADRYGTWMGKLFLVGFWAAAMSSLVGVWNGVSLMFADFMGNVTGKDSDHPDSRAGGRWYKAYILWLTFPPMVMMFLGEPVWLILAYGVLGAFFMPFLSVTLLWLLNTDRTPEEWRNRIFSNVAMFLVHARLRRTRHQRGAQGDRRHLTLASGRPCLSRKSARRRRPRASGCRSPVSDPRPGSPRSRSGWGSCAAACRPRWPASTARCCPSRRR